MPLFLKDYRNRGAAEAIREKRARIIRAKAESEASEKSAIAARVVAANPAPLPFSAAHHLLEVFRMAVACWLGAASDIHMRMQFRVVRLSGWRAIVAVLGGLIGLAAVVALLAVGFVFVVLPALVVATVAYWFFPKAKVRAMGPAGDPTVIEGTYEVAPDDAERKRLERQTPP